MTDATSMKSVNVSDHCQREGMSPLTQWIATLRVKRVLWGVGHAIERLFETVIFDECTGVVRVCLGNSSWSWWTTRLATRRRVLVRLWDAYTDAHCNTDDDDDPNNWANDLCRTTWSEDQRKYEIRECGRGMGYHVQSTLTCCSSPPASPPKL